MSIYPIFEECRDCTLDSYWKEIFSDCARNKFPKGIRYDGRKNVLYVRQPSARATKPLTYSLSNDPREVFKMMMDIFRNKMGMRSVRDLQLQQEELNEIKNSEGQINMDCEWKDIKPRYLRDQIIMDYVMSLKDKHDLTPRQTKNFGGRPKRGKLLYL